MSLPNTPPPNSADAPTSRRLLSRFFSVSGWTFLSRILGLCRDIVIATMFGAGALVDAFLAAFRLPNMLRRFTAEGALTQAFIPAYSEEQKQSPQHAANYAGELLFLLTTALSILSAIVIVFAPWVIGLVAPGLESAAEAATMLRIVFPYIVCISAVALLSGILNASGRFAAAAAAPTLLNIAMIGAALFLSSALSPAIIALAWGVLLGGIAQLLFISWRVHRVGLWPRIRARRPDNRMRQSLTMMGQSALGAGAVQINLLINLAIASLLPAGSISWLYYADRLMELPAGLLGAALATVALPAMAGCAERASVVLDNILRTAFIFAAPAAVGLALLSAPLVTVLFGHGAFDANDIKQTTSAVITYSIGIPGLVMMRPLAAAFYARHDAATPAKTAIAMLLLTQIFNFIFVYLLQWQHAGIALSVGIAACANAILLWWIAHRRGWFVSHSDWNRLSRAVLCALILMSIFLLYAVPDIHFWQDELENPFWWQVLILLGSIGASAIIYFVILRICGVPLYQHKK